MQRHHEYHLVTKITKVSDKIKTLKNFNTTPNVYLEDFLAILLANLLLCFFLIPYINALFTRSLVFD